MRPGSKELPWSEVELMTRPLLDRAREEARKRMSAAGKGDKVCQPSRALQAVAKKVGISFEQLRKIRTIVEAAEADPGRFGPLREEMDRTGKIDGPFTKLKRFRDEARVLDLAPVDGRFRTLVIDPPWDEDNISDSAGHDYALMSLDQIRALPLQDWSEDNCHLYLWVTNNTALLAADLLKCWGFQHKTIHTWTKPRLGLGRYFRNTTEHVIFAVRGELKTRSAGRSTRTDHDWPVGANSEKPEDFYNLVRACSYPPYGEAFQRLARPDFANLYAAPPAMSEAAE